jgi:hypothetical protein
MRTTGWFVNGIDGRHVLLGLIAFFGVMLVANSLLVYYALDTFSGGDRPDPYRAGLRYNDTIAAAERQAALGWQSDVAYDDDRGRLSLRFVIRQTRRSGASILKAPSAARRQTGKTAPSPSRRLPKACTPPTLSLRQGTGCSPRPRAPCKTATPSTA